MNKQDILNELQASRESLLAAIDGLTPAQMRAAGAVGIWSVKDVLAHIVAWESELVTALNHAQLGRTPSMIYIEDIDEWNEEQYHANASRTLEAIMADLEGVHRILFRMVDEFDEEMLTDNLKFSWMEGESLWYLVEESAYLHEREHAEEILAWRENEGF